MDSIEYYCRNTATNKKAVINHFNSYGYHSKGEIYLYGTTNQDNKNKFIYFGLKKEIIIDLEMIIKSDWRRICINNIIK